MLRKTLSLTIVDLTHRDTLMTENATYPIPAGFNDAHITPERYQNLYQQSLDDPDSFWSEQAQILDWHMPWRPSQRQISTGPLVGSWARN
ncbi:MAG: hypothetical protein CM15mP74_35140 [Halieaceae bacterium]|nr:MAG: hypothetical protein CM15mP74_35140 [Halieaceae bacterium]